MSFRRHVLGCIAFGLSMTPVYGADMPVKAARIAPAVATNPLTIYTFDDFVRFRSEFPGREYTSRGLISNNGFTYALSPQFVLGAGFTYSHSNNDLAYLGPGATSRTDTWVPYGTAAFTTLDGLTFGVSGGAGKSSIHQTRFPAGVAVTADPTANIWFGSAYVSRTLQYGSFYVVPTVRVTGRETQTNGYFESNGAFTPQENSTLGELAGGAQFSYALNAGNGWVFYPNVEVNGLWDFHRPLYQNSSYGLDLKAGLSATVGPWAMGAAYMTILGIDSYRDYNGGRLFLTYRFGGGAAGPAAVNPTRYGIGSAGGYRSALGTQ
jgi:hypothetical protein